MGGAPQRCRRSGPAAWRPEARHCRFHPSARSERDVVRAGGEQPRSGGEPMNLIPFAPTWLAVLLAPALLAAAIEAMVRMRISNITVLAVLAAAIAAMAFEGFHGPLWQNAVVFGAVLAIGTLMFARNLLGGGDVKLFAATALWVNFSAALALLVMIFLAGGVVALLYILVRK